MFSTLYSKAMRNGSRILFAAAILLFLAGLLHGIRLLGEGNLQPLGPGNQLQWGWLELVGAVLNGISFGVTPLIGALLVDRIDRWLARSGQASE